MDTIIMNWEPGTKYRVSNGYNHYELGARYYIHTGLAMDTIIMNLKPGTIYRVSNGYNHYELEARY